MSARLDLFPLKLDPLSPRLPHADDGRRVLGIVVKQIHDLVFSFNTAIPFAVTLACLPSRSVSLLASFLQRVSELNSSSRCSTARDL